MKSLLITFCMFGIASILCLLIGVFLLTCEKEDDAEALIKTAMIQFIIAFILGAVYFMIDIFVI